MRAEGSDPLEERSGGHGERGADSAQKAGPRLDEAMQESLDPQPPRSPPSGPERATQARGWPWGREAAPSGQRLSLVIGK